MLESKVFFRGSVEKTKNAI